MRALLTPDVAPRTGTVILRPGSELLSMFATGRRVMISTVPEYLLNAPSGALADAWQQLLDDPALVEFLAAPRVIAAAGGRDELANWVNELRECQWGGEGYHHGWYTALRVGPSAVCLCYSCDNRLREQELPRLDELARQNAARWTLLHVRQRLRLPEGDQLSLPELCWWALTAGVLDLLPDLPARRMLKLAPAVVASGTLKEADILPEIAAPQQLLESAAKGMKAAVTAAPVRRQPIVQMDEAIKQIVGLVIDPEAPEQYMRRPKRRRWVCEKYTRWIKTQSCSGCGSRADDPHHITGSGLGGWGTKPHDLFVIPLCRRCHDDLHRDTSEFEQRHGSQLLLLVQFLDHTIAVGVIGNSTKK